MSGWGTALWIGGGTLLVGGIVYAVTREEEVAAAVATVTHEVRRGAQAVERRMARMITSNWQAQRDKIAKYHIAELTQKYHGIVPFGTALAIFEHESDFEALIYNYYVKDRQGNLVRDEKGNKILRRETATPGATPVVRWTLANQDHPELNGGFAHDPHAVGLGQILDDLRLNAKPKMGFGGVALPYLTDLIDPEKNIHASLANLNNELIKWGIAAKAGKDSWLLSALTYWVHANGSGTLVGGRGKDGGFSQIKGPVTWAALAALPWGTGNLWALGNPVVGIARAANRAATWQAARAVLLGQATELTPRQQRIHDLTAQLETATPDQLAAVNTELMQLLTDEAIGSPAA